MPGSYQGYDIVKFDRAAVATLAQHVREIEDAHMREYAFPAKMEAMGRNLYNQSGRGMDWPVQYKRHTLTGNTGAQRWNFRPTNLWKQAYLEDRGYGVTDSISKLEILQNRGEAAIINLFQGFVDRMVESLNQGLAAQYFIDGNDTNNLDFWHGLMTMFDCQDGSGNGQTLNASTGVARTANQADIVGYPSGTYAGLSTELGAYGGSNESGKIWPEGDSDPEYDFWSPIVVFGDSSNAKFTGSSDAWSSQGDQVLRYALTHSAKVGGRSERLDLILLDRSMYFEFKNLMASKESIEVRRGEPNSLVSMGFGDVISIDGVEVTFDNGVPANNGFGLSVSNCSMRSLFGELLDREGPHYDFEDQSHKAVVSTLGNLKFKSPRNFFRVVRSYSNL